MHTRELCRTEWERRLTEFAVAHAGWLISLQIAKPGTGLETELDQMPLSAISVCDATQGCRITISAARSPADYLVHAIEHVNRVMVDYTGEGTEAGLWIESEDGTCTALRFRVAVPPELVDHVWHA